MQFRDPLRKRVARSLVNLVKLKINPLLHKFCQMRAISAILASRTENVIARNAPKPRSKGTAAIKFVNALPRSDDCFLEDIIHGRFFECERMNESVEHFSVLSNEDVEETFCAHWGELKKFVLPILWQMKVWDFVYFALWQRIGTDLI